MNIYADTVDFSHIQDLVTVNALMLLALLIPPWQIMDDMFNWTWLLLRLREDFYFLLLMKNWGTL